MKKGIAVTLNKLIGLICAWVKAILGSQEVRPGDLLFNKGITFVDLVEMLLARLVCQLLDDIGLHVQTVKPSLDKSQ